MRNGDSAVACPMMVAAGQDPAWNEASGHLLTSLLASAPTPLGRMAVTFWTPASPESWSTTVASGGCVVGVVWPLEPIVDENVGEKSSAEQLVGV